MSEHIVIAYRLRDGVDPSAYERWIRADDAPYVIGRPTVLRYESLRLTGPAEELRRMPVDYIELLEVTSAAEDSQVLETSEEGRRLTAYWQSVTQDALILRAEVVARHPRVRGPDG